MTEKAEKELDRKREILRLNGVVKFFKREMENHLSEAAFFEKEVKSIGEKIKSLEAKK